MAEVWPNMNVGGALTSFIAWGDKGVRNHYSPELTAVNSNNADIFLFPSSPEQPVPYGVNSFILVAVCSADFSNVLST